MKLIILLAAISCSYAAKLDRTYLPPTHAQTSGGSGFLQTPLGASQYQGNDISQAGFDRNENAFAPSANVYSQGNEYSMNGYANSFAAETRPERPRAALERNAAVLRQDNSNDGESYAYAYETENGIYAEENGVATNGVEAQGGYSYTGDDGQVYSVRYTADQNGFLPQGDHLPTSPPVPEEILKALEQNARDEAAGIYDDGSYNEAKYADESDKPSNGQFIAYDNQYNGNDDAVVTNSAVFQPLNRNQAQGINGVQKSYLPPFASQGGSDSNGNSAVFPPFSRNQDTVSTSENQNFAQETSGVQKAYLPPFASQGGANSNGNTEVFIPLSRNQDSIAAFDKQNFGQGTSGAQKAYLPPHASQEGSDSTGNFGSRSRQPSFNVRDGYRY